jgi:hypothetical protein
VQKFQDNDAGYLDWLETNPHGFVLYAERSPRKEYLILHRATCKSISRVAEPPVRWTTGGYLKVCATEINEIERWCRQEVGGNPQPCGQCRPLTVLN